MDWQQVLENKHTLFQNIASYSYNYFEIIGSQEISNSVTDTDKYK